MAVSLREIQPVGKGYHAHIIRPGKKDRRSRKPGVAAAVRIRHPRLKAHAAAGGGFLFPLGALEQLILGVHIVPAQPFIRFRGGENARVARLVPKVIVAVAIVHRALPRHALGPEAVRRLTVERFPAIVLIDSMGNNLYEIGPAACTRRAER